VDKELRKFLGVDNHIDPYDNKPYFGYGEENISKCGKLGELQTAIWKISMKLEILTRYLNIKFREGDLTKGEFFYIVEKEN